jgi:hypothetical protein
MEEVVTNQSQQLNESKLLHDKVAVIFGADGAIGIYGFSYQGQHID